MYGIFTFNGKERDVNYNLPLNLALHVDSVSPKCNLGRNNSSQLLSLVKDVKVKRFISLVGG